MTAQQEYSPHRRTINHLRLYARDDGSGSNTTIIIAVVCGVVGGIIFAFVLWQFVWKLCRPKRAPLPPVQPLVHHRQVHAASFANRDSSRPATWFEPTHLSVRHGSFPSGSDVSLIPSSPGKSPSRQGSFHTEETTHTRRLSEDASTHISAPTIEDLSLTPPMPPFSRDSSVNMGLNASTSSLDSYGTPSPPTFSSSPQSSASAISDQDDIHSQTSQRRPRVPSGRSRSRPASMASTVSTTFTVRSRSTVRGAPHSRHNNVQIVLPAPLAPSVYPEETASEVNVFMGDSLHSRPATDSWIMLGSSRSASKDKEPAKRHQRTTSESSTNRRSSRRLSRTDSPSLNQTPRPPPVPRLPSEFSQRSASLSSEQHQYPPSDPVDRGRYAQRAPSGGSTHQPHKLQKQRSRSRSKGAVLRDSSRGDTSPDAGASGYAGQPQAL
ncbi:hypothetical protein GLOTRDRAFT_113417 [Gloeophyllum trabeum ATCC 11539]|uniref:Uncharacterized protein n=1 Tax=Gloeophyllum trabeum (strain ATCC 11539 / FP-39264 / Madison 617) TaxID=670483 RepID=S7QN41_GLOTA|nr:uncharacterized protein GLOTRDRAFT_113417 [Gloeophyllum trabeum ATCC 11539]EPQ60913.1 hypothetical protein GLOTRDRAFT_113417 [Gloeophyllum trabeum ATCC 11539]